MKLSSTEWRKISPNLNIYIRVINPYMDNQALKVELVRMTELIEFFTLVIRKESIALYGLGEGSDGGTFLFNPNIIPSYIDGKKSFRSLPYTEVDFFRIIHNIR